MLSRHCSRRARVTGNPEVIGFVRRDSSRQTCLYLPTRPEGFEPPTLCLEARYKPLCLILPLLSNENPVRV
jgi:hypothetical protein